jgi:peroxiredoxin family protein
MVRSGASRSGNGGEGTPKLSLVIMSDDLERVLAAMVMASRAAVEGWEVVVVFSFWGLAAVRDPSRSGDGKSPAESFFAERMPNGADELRLRRFDEEGTGTGHFKAQMKEKRLLSIREQIAEAKEFGVRFLACGLPMEVLGIAQKELVAEVERVCTVSEYLEEARGADVNLLI